MVNRREFIKNASMAGMGATLLSYGTAAATKVASGRRIGIIGLDTSHSIAFTREFNSETESPELLGYRVTAAYPYGSLDIESSASRIPGYSEEIQNYGVKLTGSIEELLSETDVILLVTNDGRMHLEQALPVIQAGKPMFIDKPMTASLKDAITIFDEAKRHNVPVFSSSSLRFMESAQAAARGEHGKVLGATTWSPAPIEKTHPDLFWYGIHGVETLFTVMGQGCDRVSRFHSDGADVVVGVWSDGRTGSFRGIREGRQDYGGIVFAEKGNVPIGPFGGYKPMLIEIARFFETGKLPFNQQETLEILAFMEAADESKKLNGASVKLTFDRP
jgi:predicted dehydrogenase